MYIYIIVAVGKEEVIIIRDGEKAKTFQDFVNVKRRRATAYKKKNP